MMPIGNLTKMVGANTMRSPRHFVLSAFGIVIGISTFVVFLASTEQVAAVLEKIFPLEQVQVVAPRASLLGKDISKKLDDKIVKTILTRPEVKLAVPRMNLAFPAFGRGNFEGNDLKFEVGGFADGVDPAFVTDDKRIRELFKDWMSDESDPHRVACVPSTRHVAPPTPAPVPPAGSGAPPAAGSASPTCPVCPSLEPEVDPDEVIQSPKAPSKQNQIPVPASAAAAKAMPPVSVTGKNGEYYNPCPEPDRYYCDDSTERCEHRVPIVMSPTMIELYNGQFAKSHGLPVVDIDFVKWVTQRGGLSSMRFSIGLGQTTIAGSNTAIKHRPRRVEGVLVGVSNKAMPIGMTMPMGYIARWNQEFMGDEAATTYSSIIVTLKDRNQIAPFAQWLQDTLDLRLEDSLGEKFATVLFVIRLVLVLISLIIIGISAINIAHNFFMQVTERRRELGLLRAVGATQADVRMVVLGEAALIGLIGGLLGVLLGLGIAAGIDYASAHYLPRFPYKPTTWFNFKWWIWAGGLACSCGFAVLGGYLPARRASTMEPAQALTQN
jgi:putative ABC transport system permease protein